MSLHPRVSQHLVTVEQLASEGWSKAILRGKRIDELRAPGLARPRVDRELGKRAAIAAQTISLFRKMLNTSPAMMADIGLMLSQVRKDARSALPRIDDQDLARYGTARNSLRQVLGSTLDIIALSELVTIQGFDAMIRRRGSVDDLHNNLAHAINFRALGVDRNLVFLDKIELLCDGIMRHWIQRQQLSAGGAYVERAVADALRGYVWGWFWRRTFKPTIRSATEGCLAFEVTLGSDTFNEIQGPRDCTGLYSPGHPFLFSREGATGWDYIRQHEGLHLVWNGLHHQNDLDRPAKLVKYMIAANNQTVVIQRRQPIHTAAFEGVLGSFLSGLGAGSFVDACWSEVAPDLPGALDEVILSKKKGSRASVTIPPTGKVFHSLHTYEVELQDLFATIIGREKPSTPLAVTCMNLAAEFSVAMSTLKASLARLAYAANRLGSKAQEMYCALPAFLDMSHISDLWIVFKNDFRAGGEIVQDVMRTDALVTQVPALNRPKP